MDSFSYELGRQMCGEGLAMVCWYQPGCLVRRGASQWDQASNLSLLPGNV